MNRTAPTVLIAAILSLTACGPSHNHSPFLEVGSPLPLTVTVPDDMALDAQADVLYRLPASRTDYQRQALTQRGNQFHTTLPTTGLREGESVAYYFDITAAGEFTPLRSPDNPYLTTFVSQDELILRSLRDTVAYKDDQHEVVFKVSSTRAPLQQARVIYSPPDLAGYVVADMERFGSNWSFTIDPARVAPGVWSYRIEAELDGVLYSLPAPDQWETFRLPAAPSPPPSKPKP